MQSVSAISQEREMGKAYRQYSRHRYQQLKAAGRIMRESEIIQVIIREWDNMTPAQRRRFLNGASMDALATPAKIPSDMVPLDIKNKSNLKTTNQKPPSEQGEEDNDRMLRGEMMPGESMQETPMKKTKAIRKSSQRMKDYISFYRFHYRRLSMEHPNWKSAHISVIIGLKWRQEKAKLEKERMKRNKNPQMMTRKMPKITGRRLFNRIMKKGGMKYQIVSLKWKKLPQESKKLWQRRADSTFEQVDRSRMSSMVKLPMESRDLMELMERK